MNDIDNCGFHIIGAGRGGTSLLAGLIDAHRQCQVVFEKYSVMYLMGRQDTEAERCQNPKDRKARRMDNFLRACDEHVAKYPGLICGHKSTTEQIKGLDFFGEQSHQPDHVDTSCSLEDIGTVDYFAGRISNKKVIFILRDGRTCVQSKVNRSGQSLQEAIKRWKFCVYVLNRLKNICPDFYLIKFEELIKYPEDKLKDICDFLGIEYDSRMLEGTSNPKMLKEYRRPDFDRSKIEIGGIDPRYVRAMRDELVVCGYINPNCNGLQ